TALFWPHTAPATRPPAQAPLQVSLLPTPPAPSSAAKNKAEPKNFLQPALPHAVLPVVAVAVMPAPDNSDLLSDSQLAGAARAGEGGPGGGGCDTARAVQQALRRDPLVRAAVE